MTTKVERMPNWLKKRAQLTPNRPAIEFDEKVYTFLELDLLAESTARKAAALGLQQGDTCAVLIRNDIRSVALIHGLFYLGVRIVMLNHRLTANELTWQVKDSQADQLIFDAVFSEKGKQVQRQLPLLKIASMEVVQQVTEDNQARIVSEYVMDETATIMYTSGTTGNPKGVIQTFGNHWWSAIGSVLNLGLNEKDCWYCGVPIFHISGLSILMRNMIYGMKVVLAEKFTAIEANKMIQEKGITIISVVTTMLNRMIQDLGDEGYPASFRCMLLGGGPAPKYLLEECKAKQIPVYQTYGMTETASQIVTLSPEDSLEKLGSAGKALFPSQLRIEIDGHEAGPNEHGEIVVAGPNVTSGYLNQMEATEKAIKDGWLYTGDIGYLDSEGFLFVMDRRCDLLISGGENVYPAEIEAVISKHPAVFESGVTSIEDEKWGQVPIAFVVTNKNHVVTEEELLMYVKENLAPYKVPKYIYFCEELPRNAANKLMRRKLKELGSRS